MSVETTTAQRKFPWKPEDPTKVFDLLQCMDEGSFGQVWRGKLKNSDSEAQVAIKVITEVEDIYELAYEIHLLANFDSDFIIRLHGSWCWNDEFWIVMELADLGALDGINIYCNHDFTEPEISAICARTLLGLDHMHSKGFVHRDIKSKNLLLTMDGQVKIADFGLTVHEDNVESADFSGTIHFMSPEMVRGSPYTGISDIWSVGITVIELAEKHPPHNEIGIQQANAFLMIINLILDSPPPTFLQPFKWSSALQSFLSDCVTVDPAVRPSAAQLFEHPFVRDEVANARKGNHTILKILAQASFQTVEKQRENNELHGKRAGNEAPDPDDEFEIYSEDEYDDSDSDEGVIMMVGKGVNRLQRKKSRKKTMKSKKSNVSLMREAFNDGRSMTPKMRNHKERVQNQLKFSRKDLEAQLNNLNSSRQNDFTKAQVDRAQKLLSDLMAKKKIKKF